MQTKKKVSRQYVYYIPAAILAIVFIMVWHARQASSDKPIIRTATVERGTVTATVSANGTLQPLTTVEVKSNVGGQVVKFVVDEGYYVKAGQLLAKIDPTDSQTALDESNDDLSSAISKVEQASQTLSMQNQQNNAQVLSARRGLEAARAKLMEAQVQAKTQPSLTVAAINDSKSNYAAVAATLKQMKTALIPQELVSAQASYDQAKANFDTAEKDLVRQKALLAKGFVAKSAVDTSQATYGVDKGVLDSARMKLETIKEQTDQDLKSAEAKLAQAKAQLDNAEANRIQDQIKKQEEIASRSAVKQAEAALQVALAAEHQDSINRGNILQAKAQVHRSGAVRKSAATNLGYCTITAPCEGLITKKYVEQGSIVTGGKTSAVGSGSGVAIVDIADVSEMDVLVSVDETDIAQVELGEEVNVTVEAYPDELFTGRVKKIAPQSEVTQNVTTVPVTVKVDVPDSRLKPGMNATCDFITDSKRNVLMVPNDAVKGADTTATVTVLEGDKQVPCNVEVGLIGKDYTEIIKGLKEGQKVVTSVIQPGSTTRSSSGMPGSPGGPGGMGGGRPMGGR